MKLTLRKWQIGIFIGCLAIALAACNRTTAPQASDVMVGNDRDEHGCIGSAGYAWSELKQECIRTWEVGIAMQNSQDPEASTVAYVVTKEGSGNVEIYLPEVSGGMLLHKHHGIWTDAKHQYQLILKPDANTYKLYGRERKLLYQSVSP